MKLHMCRKESSGGKKFSRNSAFDRFRKPSELRQNMVLFTVVRFSDTKLYIIS